MERPAGTDEAALRAVAEAIRGRRTTNLYEQEPVPEALLREAIEVARWAPNHRLTEPWRFYLLGPERLGEVIDCWVDFEARAKGEAAGEARRKRLEAIPGHFILTSRRDDDELIDLENYAASCCAAQNLMLYLWQCGVGTKWTSGAITREPRFLDLLAIDPQQERMVGYFWYGRPKLVGEQRRKPVEDVIVEYA